MLDWPGLMRAGLRGVALGGLGLRPGAFWALSPAELAVMLGREAAAPPLNRARLEEMARLWPDPVPARPREGEAGHDG